jgi:hypothetical protein
MCWQPPLVSAAMVWCDGAMKFWAVSLLITALWTSPALADVTWVTVPFADHCKQAAASDVDNGEDWIVYKCKGVGEAATWQVFNEGTRMSLGFGKAPHVSINNISTHRESNWPVEWGGEKKKGIFLPSFVIIRVLNGFEENPKSELTVVRLLPTGASCVIGDVPAGQDQNRRAKQIARSSIKKWTCQNEPEPLKF